MVVPFLVLIKLDPEPIYCCIYNYILQITCSSALRTYLSMVHKIHTQLYNSNFNS